MRTSSVAVQQRVSHVLDAQPTTQKAKHAQSVLAVSARKNMGKTVYVKPVAIQQIGLITQDTRASAAK
jgi:hypothetical protein